MSGVTTEEHGPEEPVPARPARPPVPPPLSPAELVAGRDRPRVVDVSCWSWLAASLAGAVATALSLRYFDDFIATLLAITTRDNPGTGPDTLQEVATLGASVLIGAGALIVLLQAFLALGMVTGRNWARLLLVPVGALGVIYAALVFVAVPGDVQVPLAVGAVLAVVAMVAMFMPGTGVWFERAREYM